MLPRVIIWVVRAVAPASHAPTILADLERDYASGRSRWWLWRETQSLVVSYALARVSSWRRLLPLLARDAQIVLRGLRRGTAPLIASAMLLGVGLAAVTLTAGLLETLLYRQVSVTNGVALRRVLASDRQGRTIARLSYPELEQIRGSVDHEADIAAVYLQPAIVRARGASLQTMVEIASGAYFRLTGTTPVLGRVLLSADDRLEAAPVAVLAEAFWRRHFDASPAALGSIIQLNGASFTVVGVAGAQGSVSSLGASVDAWITASQADAVVSRGWRENVGERWFTAFVLPRSDPAAVDAALLRAQAELARRYPDPWRQRRLLTGDATLLIGAQRDAAATFGVVLGGLAALILLAAASNVSGVLVARAAAHRRSNAILLSLGAGRSVLVRRQLLEGALLGVAAATVAAFVHQWLRNQLVEVSLLPTLALRFDLPQSFALIAGTVAAGAVIGMVLAVAPALWSARVDTLSALREGDGRGGGGRLAGRLRRLFVATQVAVSLVLVTGALLFMRSFDALATTDLGFSRDGLVAMDFDLQPMSTAPDALPSLAREALARVAGLPDVRFAAMSSRAPIDQSTPVGDVQRPGEDGSRVGDVTTYLATEDYFATVGVPLLAGRVFARVDADMETDVAIVNQTLANRLWPDGDVLGRPVVLWPEGRTLSVIGVAADSKYRTLAEMARPHLYRPTRPRLGLTLLARTSGEPRRALAAIQRELDRVGPGLVGFFPRTLDDHLAVQLLPTRVAANASSVLGVLALALSAAALYALVSWSVTLRQREIGVRMALGASPSQVRRLVVGQAVDAAWPGMVGGVFLAVALAAAIRSALVGVGPADPVALGTAMAALGAVALLAGYLPSRAATKIDQAQTLRQ